MNDNLWSSGFFIQGDSRGIIANSSVHILNIYLGSFAPGYRLWYIYCVIFLEGLTNWSLISAGDHDLLIDKGYNGIGNSDQGPL